MPGRCYIVFEDLDLTKYSNSLAMAQAKAELVIGSTVTSLIDVGTLSDTRDTSGATESAMLSSAVIDDSGVSYSLARVNLWTGAGYGGATRRFQFGEADALTNTTDYALNTTSGRHNSAAICSQCAPGTLPVFIRSDLPVPVETEFYRIDGATVTQSQRLSTSTLPYGAFVRIAADESGF